tara:strand:- start:377 stop:706 length:330 start_codon:yes stop_codon:yes gene_type:complete
MLELLAPGVEVLAAGVVILADGIVEFETFDLVALILLDAFEVEVLFEEVEEFEGDELYIEGLEEFEVTAVVFGVLDSELLLVIVVEASGSFVSLRTEFMSIAVPVTFIS